MRVRYAAAACLAVLLTAATMATAQMQHGDHGGTVAAENAWARASVGQTGAAYVTLVNRGASDDRLVSARSEVAARLSLHTHEMEGNIMRMRPVEAIPVPAGRSVTLAPGGYHVMMIGLTSKLSEGDEFPMTLVFEKAGEVPVTVPVMKMGAMGPSPSHGHGGMRH